MKTKSFKVKAFQFSKGGSTVVHHKTDSRGEGIGFEIKLKWGCTPWDQKDRLELLHDLENMCQLFIECHKLLRMHRRRDDNPNPFWKEGVGFEAFQKFEFIIRNTDFILMNMRPQLSLWNKMGKDSLLREVQRFYSALQSAHGVLQQVYESDALFEMGDYRFRLPENTDTYHRLSALFRMESFQSTYHSFFRYADDLLFDNIPRVGSGWMVCDQCQCKIVNYLQPCLCPKDCNEMRPLTWEDMKPQGAVCSSQGASL